MWYEVEDESTTRTNAGNDILVIQYRCLLCKAAGVAYESDRHIPDCCPVCGCRNVGCDSDAR